MVDFMMVSERLTKKRWGNETAEVVEVYPKFKIKNPSSDLMIKGNDFYAVWDERKGLWSTSEQDAIEIIDGELDKYAEENKARFDPRPVRVLHMWDAETGMIDRWHNYVKKQMRDSFVMLDEKLIFSNTEVKKEDYASKRLPYPLAPGSTEAWDTLIGQLYGGEEAHKIEWCLGSIVNGASKKIHKFMALYGEPGSGKSTLLDIIDKLFAGYTESVDSNALGSANNAFALESFKNNPLVGIQHEGNLSKIEDNTRLNSLVSHDKMIVNEKHKSLYTSSFKTFLILSSNYPIKITNAKSGVLRRLIDVSPTGNLFSESEYNRLKKKIDFELGAIAWKCKEVYEAAPGYYNKYVPISMLGATNDFYNFVMDMWPIFRKQDQTTLKAAWGLYTTWCEETRVPYPYSQRSFKEELKNYFREFEERATIDGVRVRNLYTGFKSDKFESEPDEDEEAERTEEKSQENNIPDWLHMTDHDSKDCLLDQYLADMPAQYPTEDGGRLERKWVNCRTHLKDLDTHKLHHVKVPEQFIVIDFDISVNGEKNLERSLQEAAKWPATYAELSKSGKAIHLHYIYEGNVSELSSVYDDHIEIKTLLGDASLRRCLSKCNDVPIATISTGLPKKDVKKTVDLKQISSEKGLRTLIRRNLAKEIHPGTKPSMDFIEKILNDAYESGLNYDISDMRNAITAFAAGSTHQADYCLKLAGRLQYRGKEAEELVKTASERLVDDDRPIVFFDVEIFPNLFLVNWKRAEKLTPKDFEGANADEQWKKYIEWMRTSHGSVTRMINPKPAEIEELLQNKLVGFNCRRYDNHMLYARMMGYSNAQLYMLSKRIVNGDRTAFFGEAYNLSYTDVYDFASAGNKMSLKKLEIKMGFFHQELGLEWDKPVPEKLWPKVAAYCDNDVLATEAAFRYLEPDWTARQILADVAGLTVNDTTNGLTTRIIFDQVRKPQNEFQYRNLAEPVKELAEDVMAFLKDADPEMMSQLHGEEDSLLPYFPGYCFEKGVSTYQGEEVGEGGYVYAEPGMYTDVALLDIASMHPHSVIAECLFGPRFTRRFKEIVDGRVDIKHEAWDEVNTILDGKMAPYIARVKSGEMTSKDLANALKTAINSVYGLTSAAFENAFRDPRNVDNIVAKRGALFMVNLKKEVQSRGYTVAHIKTDSIKIPGAGPDIINFVMGYGKQYGYTFEHEATYDRMCLVNNAVYIAKYASAEWCNERYGYSPGDNKKKGGKWTATGKQFAVPYVFKTLFSKEPIQFEDLCETFQVTGSLYLDFNEKLPDVSEKEKFLLKALKEIGWSYEDYLDFIGGAEPKSPLSIENERDLRRIHNDIQQGHDYRFVGRVGLFTPVKSGCGGGLLMRESGGKFSSATGAKDWRWCESESINSIRAVVGQDKPWFRMEDIDHGYYIRLVDDAKDAIGKYGDIEWFLNAEKF